MRLVSVGKLKEGMIVGKKVYNNLGNVLLNKDIELTYEYINRLNYINIPAIYIKDRISEGIEINEVIDAELKINTITTLEKEFSFLKQKKGKKLLPQKSYSRIKEAVGAIFEQLLLSDGTLLNMTEMMSTDIYTYEHSINVSILSMMIASELNYSEKRIVDIGLGAMLHDIGKVAISDEILFKNKMLTDDEFLEIKKHSNYGYEMVKDDKFISSFTKSIILLHHEKLDGTGYPKGLKGDDFKNLEHVKIVTAADILDALINDRVYKHRIPVYRALEIICSQVPEKIDPTIFEIMKKKIEPYPTGTGVLLNNGIIGLVEKNNPDHPTRPIVRIIFDENGKEINEKKSINMMSDLTIFIDDFYEI